VLSATGLVGTDSPEIDGGSTQGAHDSGAPGQKKPKKDQACLCTKKNVDKPAGPGQNQQRAHMRGKGQKWAKRVQGPKKLGRSVTHKGARLDKKAFVGSPRGREKREETEQTGGGKLTPALAQKSSAAESRSWMQRE